MKYKVLDLFSGTGSVSKALERYNHIECISVDLFTVDGHKPTFQEDILTWKYWEHFKPGEIHAIFGGCPCDTFSKINNMLKTPRPKEQIDHGIAMVKKTIEIIKYLKPKYYFIENPRYGSMHKLPCMRGRKRVHCNYCMYGFDYPKPTTIFTNHPDLKLKVCNGRCSQYVIDNKKHYGGTLTYIQDNKSLGKARPKSERSCYPPTLIHDIFEQTDVIPKTRSGRVSRPPVFG